MVASVCGWDEDCGEGGTQWRDSASFSEGVPLPGPGVCTASCELYCEDSTSPFTSTTFCVDLGAHSAPEVEGEAEQGWCLSQCDRNLFPENNGCAADFVCEEVSRANQPDVIREACIPSSLAGGSGGDEE